MYSSFGGGKVKQAQESINEEGGLCKSDYLGINPIEIAPQSEGDRYIGLKAKTIDGSTMKCYQWLVHVV